MTGWKTEIDSPCHYVVLVVSDRTETAAQWVGLFRQKGFMVINETPEYCGQAARIVAPWLVLVDVDIPHAERLELCRRLKGMSAGALLSLIPSRPDEIAAAYAAGVDECLVRPLNPAMVLVKAMAWMVHQQLAGPAWLPAEAYL